MSSLPKENKDWALRARDLLILAAWFGLMTGLLEGISRTVLQSLGGVGEDHLGRAVLLPGSFHLGRRGTGAAQPVSLVDLPSTVMHLLGLPSKFPGAPLPLVDQPTADGVSNEKLLLAEFYTVEAGPRLKSLMNSQWHYIVEYHTGVDMLFDLRVDAAELHDLSQLPESAAVLAEFRKQMKVLFPQIAPPKGAAKAPGAAD